MLHKFFSIIKDTFFNLDKIALHILKNGLYFCAFLCIISILVLLVYNFFLVNPLIFEIGLTLFKTSIIFAIEFIICAIAADKIKNQIT